MFMSNISPLNLPPYNRAVAIVLLLTSIIGLTSLIGLSPKIDPQGPAHANIMNVFRLHDTVSLTPISQKTMVH